MTTVDQFIDTLPEGNVIVMAYIEEGTRSLPHFRIAGLDRCDDETFKRLLKKWLNGCTTIYRQDEPRAVTFQEGGAGEEPPTDNPVHQAVELTIYGR